jgi:hypothetical protein
MKIPLPNRILAGCTVGTIGLGSKVRRVHQTSGSNSCLTALLQAFLNLWTKRTTVTGLDYLVDALKEENREGRGVMTGKSRLQPNSRRY